MKPRRWTRGTGGTVATPLAAPVVVRPWLDEAWCRRRHGEEQGGGYDGFDFLRGQALHVKGLLEPGQLPTLLAEAGEVGAWSTHAKAETWGPAAEGVFATLARVFGVHRIAGRRFNVYGDGEGKPLHQDRNVHSEAAGNLTIAASFGARRLLSFVPLGQEWREEAAAVKALQEDGDVFCFTSDANARYLHGVDPGPGVRVSLVLWGDAEPLEDVVARL
jgi:hypothetical protein